MASKFQKRPFPINQLARMQAIRVIDSNGQTVDIDYQELKLIVSHGQLCFFYQDEEIDLVLPIARLTRIEKLANI